MAKKLGTGRCPGQQKIEKHPQTGNDKSKRFTTPGLAGGPDNKQRMITGIDPKTRDTSKRFNPPPV